MTARWTAPAAPRPRCMTCDQPGYAFADYRWWCHDCWTARRAASEVDPMTPQDGAA